MTELNVTQLIDCCIGSKGSHFDIARVSFCVLGDQFRYIGDSCWEKKLDNGEWVPDTDRREIEMGIRMQVCQHIMERATYWQRASLVGDISLRIDCQIRAARLMEICCKLGKDTFVRSVIKEARALFVYEPA